MAAFDTTSLNRGQDGSGASLWRRDGATLVVLTKPRHLARFLKHLDSVTGPEAGEVVVAVPMRLPLWWVLAVSSGFGPAGVSDEDVASPQRLGIERTVSGFPEHDGLTVHCIGPSMWRGVGRMLESGRFARALVVADERSFLRKQRIVDRAARLCATRLIELPD